MSDSGSLASTPRRTRSRSQARQSQSSSFHGLDPRELRFKPPANFTHENLTGQSKPQLLKEHVVNDGDDDTELWLVRVPVGVDMAMLNDTEVFLDGVQELGKLSEKGQEVYESRAFHDTLIQNSRMTVLLPSEEKKALVTGPEFKGQLNITQTMTLPALNFEMARQHDDNVLKMPEGLKIRYTPFAAGTTTVRSSDRISPASRKRKHKEKFTKIVQKAIDIVDKSLEVGHNDPVVNLLEVGHNDTVNSLEVGHNDTVVNSLAVGHNDTVVNSVEVGHNDPVVNALDVGHNDHVVNSLDVGHNDTVVNSLDVGHNNTVVNSLKVGHNDHVVNSLEVGHNDTVVKLLEGSPKRKKKKKHHKAVHETDNVERHSDKKDTLTTETVNNIVYHKVDIISANVMENNNDIVKHKKEKKHKHKHKHKNVISSDLIKLEKLSIETPELLPTASTEENAGISKQRKKKKKHKHKRT